MKALSVAPQIKSIEHAEFSFRAIYCAVLRVPVTLSLSKWLKSLSEAIPTKAYIQSYINVTGFGI